MFLIATPSHVKVYFTGVVIYTSNWKYYCLIIHFKSTLTRSVLCVIQTGMEKKQTLVMGSFIWVADLLKRWITLPQIPRNKHKMCLCTISATITDLQADHGADIRKALLTLNTSVSQQSTFWPEKTPRRVSRFISESSSSSFFGLSASHFCFVSLKCFISQSLRLLGVHQSLLLLLLQSALLLHICLLMPS